MTVEAVVYTPDGATRREADTQAAVEAARAESGTTWVRVSEADDAEIERVATVFDIHPLAVEDVRTDVRPKTEEYEAYTMVLLKEGRLSRGETTFEEEVAEVPVGLFVGPDWLLTLSLERVAAVDRVWEGVVGEEPRLLARGPDFAAYRVLDRLVDEYFDLLDAVESDIERYEEDVLAAPDIETLEGINEVRRDLLSLRKLLWPTREAVGVLARGDPSHVQEATEKYYRDVYDHLVQLVDLTETYRDLASGARDIYLNALSMSTNEVMKTLTVVATIVLPLTLVVGLYGMNFAGSAYNMPELRWQFGYPAVLLGMALVSVVLLWYFRREGWL